MSNRTALVTGSSSGIGRAVAERLLSDGWRVHGIDVAPSGIAHQAYFAHTVDLADEAATDAVLDDTLAQGVPGALVHAAGILRVGRLGSLKSADTSLMWRLHVDAAMRIANRLVPSMSDAGGGRVVMIGSRVSAGMPGRSQYAACKAALVALTRSWAAEFVSSGVTVNLVSPSATETPMLVDPSRAGAQPRLPPIGRFIRPAEIAALVAYLLSPDAVAITGQDIAICGGASLQH